jgi:hypothetical protein
VWLLLTTVPIGSSAISSFHTLTRPAAFRPILAGGLAFREVWFSGILLFIEDIPSSDLT